jgi:hypothetical protein
LDLVHANSDGPTLFRVSDLTIDRWRLTSSTRFDGRTWRFDQDGQTDPLSLAPDWGANLSDSNDDQRWWRETDAQVELVNLNKDVLPLPVGPTAVIATSSVIEANYNPGIDALTVTDGQSGLESYKLLTDVLDRAALTGGSAQLSHGEQSWTSLDDLPHERDIRQLAKDLTIGSTSDLQRLQAIVDYLRGAQFTYDLTPPEQSTDDPVWSFLSSKRGYCIHFATAMVVLATAIGLPARVAIGYAHGHAQSDGWMSFNAATAHMWPEIYFDRLGWVPFEPTPGSSEDQPDHNASSAAPSATASTSAAPSATASSAANSHPSPAANQSTTPNATLISRSSSSILLVMALIVLAAITAGALIWRWRRVDRFTPEQAWRQIERLGQRREHFPAGLTVAQVVERFQTRLPADNALTDPLVQLADEIQRRRYQPPSASLGLREADPSNSRRWWRLVRHLSQIVRRN